jgi:hypothetical protein
VIAFQLSITQMHPVQRRCIYLVMDSLNETVDDLLAFESSPKSSEFDAGRPVYKNFDFTKYLNGDLEIEPQGSGFGFEDLLSFDIKQQPSYNEAIPDDSVSKSPLNREAETEAHVQQQPISKEADEQPTPPNTPTLLRTSEKELLELRKESIASIRRREIEQQNSYNEHIPESFTAKSASNFDSSAKQPAASTSSAATSMVSSNGRGYSSQPIGNTVSNVDPSPLFSALQPEYQFDWDIHQVPDQVRFGKVGAGQSRRDYGLDMYLMEAENEVVTKQAARQEHYEMLSALPRFETEISSDAFSYPVPEIHTYAGFNGEGVDPTDHFFGLSAHSGNYELEQPAYPANKWSRQPVQPAGQQYGQLVNQSNAWKGQLMDPQYFQEFEEKVEPQVEEGIETASQAGERKESKTSKPSKREAKNKRSEKIKKIDPRRHYTPLPDKPRSWGTINPDTSKHTFEYTVDGELIHSFKFTVPQMQEYFTEHPRANGPLTLWIQICPADSIARYPHKEHSHKCRFRDCPIINNSIAVGEYRVAFDEQSARPLTLDPFQTTAGYVHLFCLEKYFDFPRLCQDFNVRADTRVFPAEPKSFAIDRDHQWVDLEKVAEDFIRNSQSWGMHRDGDYYPHTLCYALTEEKMMYEPSTRQSTRTDRNGNSVDKHFNNLEFKAENIARRKDKLPMAVYPRPSIEKPVKARQARKRKSSDEDDDSDASSSRSPAKKCNVAERVRAKKSRSPRRPSPKRSSVASASSSKSEVEKRHEEAELSSVSTRSQSKKRKSSDEDDSEDGWVLSLAKKGKIEKGAGELRWSTKKSETCQALRRQSRDEEGEASQSSVHSTPRSSVCEAGGSGSEGSPKAPRAPKRKRELEEERSPTKLFRDHVGGSLVKYGLKRQKKGDAAGLKSPFVDDLRRNTY